MRATRFFIFFSAIGLLFVCATLVQATPITVANSTFNDPPGSGATGFLVGTPASWDSLGAVGVFNPVIYFPSNSDGVYVNHDGTDVALAYGSTTLGQWLLTESLVDGKTYTLSVQAAGRKDAYLGATFTLALVAGVSGNLADNITLGTSGAFTPTKGTFDTDQFALTYIAANYDPKYSVLGINISALGTIPPDQILFDNVRLDAVEAAIPEPVTLLLLGSGLIGLVVARRRFKR